MTRDEIFQVIRRHLADELEVDPASISEATRFKEDLEADSLDLYTLVQELEDSYGVRISDEQAAQIRTVGQAVEFVLSVAGGDAEAPPSRATDKLTEAPPSGAADQIQSPAGAGAREPRC